jgi:hypothetical protein
MAKEHGSVVYPAAPKAERERQAEDEIEKSEAELFGDDARETVPVRSGDGDYIRHPDLMPEKPSDGEP